MGASAVVPDAGTIEYAVGAGAINSPQNLTNFLPKYDFHNFSFEGKFAVTATAFFEPSINFDIMAGSKLTSVMADTMMLSC